MAAFLEWRPQALKDLEEIEAYYERVAPDYAAFFVEQVFDKADQLERFPRMGRMVPEIEDEAIRELIYRDYRIIYFVDVGDGEVAVLTVIHSAQQFGGLDFDDE
jgi:plasmid stabilization system protein ParE